MSQNYEDAAEAPLVAMAQAGDEQAFTTLMNHYHARLCRYLLGLVRNNEDKDDLAQETFFRAWRELPRLKDTTRFRAWLFTIATNLVRDRKRLKQFEKVPLEDGEQYEGPHRFEDAVVERDIVFQALKQLRLKHRMCLLLEIEGKLAVEEIAQVMDLDRKSVYTYISMARRDFRLAYHALHQQSQGERKSI